jgi:hypothetical protein
MIRSPIKGSSSKVKKSKPTTPAPPALLDLASFSGSRSSAHYSYREVPSEDRHHQPAPAAAAAPLEMQAFHGAAAPVSCSSLPKVARSHAWDWAALLLLVAVDVLLNVIEPFHRFVGAGMMTDLRYPMKGNTVPVWAVPVRAANNSPLISDPRSLTNFVRVKDIYYYIYKNHAVV